MQPQEQQPVQNNTQPTPPTTPSTPAAPTKVFDTKKITIAVIASIVGVIILAVAIVVIVNLLNQPQKPTGNSDNDDPGTTEVGKPKEIDLQLAVDQWLTTQPAAANSGIIIYDIDNNSVVARHNENVQFGIDTISQMFIAYEGYYRIDHDMLDGTAVYPIGDDFEGKPYTRNHCLDFMVRFSYLPCSNIMINEIGFDNLQAAYNQRGFKNTNIAASISTPSDLMKLYQMYWKHNDLSDNSWDKIQESMLNQVAATKDPVYAQNWRMGIPSGISTALVYNKVGMYGVGTTWVRFSDASFLVYPEVEKNKDGEAKPARHYISIVLTKDTTPQEIVKLGRKIEEAIKTADNY